MAKKNTSVPADDADLDGVDFEAALNELETLVTQMEAGEMTLEASLSAFERGVKLTRHCQAALKNAELKVKVLTDENTLEDLDIEDLDDA
ncbi:MAG: exodeoxyribonuclease VII small subunit [Gammaproteobacteria bacterium]|nr:exodeoxyribonuclease VII small subunit [Gammaproteobacteria bacterium]